MPSAFKHLENRENAINWHFEQGFITETTRDTLLSGWNGTHRDSLIIIVGMRTAGRGNVEICKKLKRLSMPMLTPKGVNKMWTHGNVGRAYNHYCKEKGIKPVKPFEPVYIAPVPPKGEKVAFADRM